MAGKIRRTISTAAKKAVRAAKIITRRQLSRKQLEKTRDLTTHGDARYVYTTRFPPVGAAEGSPAVYKMPKHGSIKEFIYDKEGQLLKKRLITGKPVKEKKIEYNPPGRFIGRRVRKK